jgi:hypothetical protein
MACCHEPGKRIPQWLALYAPWMTAGDVAALISDVTRMDERIGRPLLPTADQMGWALRITIEQRSRWGLKTIGAIDDSTDRRKARRKAADRARKAADRAAKGATRRHKAKTRVKPWAACGMSKRTWYRRGQPLPIPEKELAAKLKRRIRNMAQIRPQRILKIDTADERVSP